MVWVATFKDWEANTYFLANKEGLILYWHSELELCKQITREKLPDYFTYSLRSVGIVPGNLVDYLPKHRKLCKFNLKGKEVYGLLVQYSHIDHWTTLRSETYSRSFVKIVGIV